MHVEIIYLSVCIEVDFLNPFWFCSLTFFYRLGWNGISFEGTHKLAEALQVNQSLQELK